MGKSAQITLALHDDLINQVAYALHESGWLNASMGEEELFMLSSLPGITNLKVQLEPLLPPLVLSCGREEAYLQVGD